MPLEFIDLNSPSIVAVNCNNQKTMGKLKLHRTSLKKLTKIDNIEFRKKTLTKWKSDLKSIKS